MINFFKSKQKAPQTSAHIGIFTRNDGELGLSEFLQNKTTPLSANEATKISAVYACVNLLSQTIGTLPFALYHKSSDKEPFMPFLKNGWDTNIAEFKAILKINGKI